MDKIVSKIKAEWGKFSQKFNLFIVALASYIQFVDASIMDFVPADYRGLVIGLIVMTAMGLGATPQPGLRK